MSQTGTPQKNEPEESISTYDQGNGSKGTSTPREKVPTQKEGPGRKANDRPTFPDIMGPYPVPEDDARKDLKE